MITACKLNNKNMRNLRRSEEYQCIMVDLAMLGVISKEECEMLIGGRIPNNLTLPNGKQGHLISEANIPTQPVKVDGTADGSTPAAGTDTSAGDTSDTGTVPADGSTPDLTLDEGSGLSVPAGN